MPIALMPMVRSRRRITATGIDDAMYRNILLAYDGSPDGREALHQVIEITAGSQAIIHLLVVIELSEGIVPVDGFYFARDYEETCADRVLDEGLQALRLHGIAAKTVVRSGSPAQQIASCAREIGADLVVVGHRKQNAIVRWLNGSVSAAVLNRAPCSVLVARGREFQS